MNKFKLGLLSVVTASLLVGCGSSSSSDGSTEDSVTVIDSGTATESATTLRNINIEKKNEISIATQVSAFADDGYNEMGDSQITSISGNENYTVTGSKWHNGLSIIDLNTSTATFTPFSALKAAGHNTADSVSGATESQINQVEIIDDSVFVNIEKINDTEVQGLYKVSIQNGAFSLEDGQIKSDARIDEAFKNFAVSNDGSQVVAFDGANLVSYDKDLVEQASAEKDVISYDFNDDGKLITLYKDGITPYVSLDSAVNGDAISFNKDVQLNFEPTLLKTLPDNKVLLIEEKDQTALSVSIVDSSKNIVTNNVSEIIGTNNIYSISDDGRFLAVGTSSDIKIVSLYSTQPEVLERITANATSIDFISSTVLAYTTGNEINTFTLTEGDEITKSDLIAKKLEVFTQDDINNELPFVEVRKDLDLSTTTLYDSIDVSYDFSENIKSYFTTTGEFTQPDVTTVGQLIIKGTEGDDVGIREIDITLIGKDNKKTVVFDDETLVNSVTLGEDKVVLATDKGLRTYNVGNDELTAIQTLVLPTDIDEIVTPEAFTSNQIFKVNDTTIIGLGKKFTGETITTLSKGSDVEVKLYDAKIFKTTLNIDGTIDTTVFIDVNATDILGIDLSNDKKSLAVLLSSDPKYIVDADNAGYYTANDENTSALVYDVVNDQIKTAKFTVERADTDTSPEDIIDINDDGTKLLISEGHHGVLKLYDVNGTQLSTGANYTDDLNHMSSHYITGDTIYAFPIKSPQYYTIDISDNNLSIPVKHAYTNEEKHWALKGELVGEELYIPKSNRYVGGEPGLMILNTTTNVQTEKEYQIYQRGVSVNDIDLVDDQIILSGDEYDAVYLNIQDK